MSEQPVKESDRLETDARWGLFLCCHGLYDVFEYVTLELEYLTKLNSYCPSLSIDTVDYVIGIGHIFFFPLQIVCGHVVCAKKMTDISHENYCSG